MANEIISYFEMCRREGVSLQRDMNFHISHTHSVILMSVRPNAPYADRVENDGSTLIYEGHDVPQSSQYPNTKVVDQPGKTPSGRLTENGKFYNAAKEFKANKQKPERVRVYEKIRSGIWAYNGTFHLVDAWLEPTENRNVFKFKLIAVESENNISQPIQYKASLRRIIPTSVKLEVWKRDAGECVKCGASNDLHFDHIIPWSRGGSSLTSDNIQLLCGKHNIKKRDKIE